MNTMKYCTMALGLALGVVFTAHAQLGPQNNLYEKMVFGTEGPGKVDVPKGIAVTGGANYEIFVVDSGNDRVSVFTQEGTYVRSIGSTFGSGESFVDPVGIDIRGPDLFVTDIGQHCVYRFHIDGTYLNKISGPPEQPLMKPADVCATETGEIFVAEQDADAPFRILIFQNDGSFIRRIITAGSNDFELGYPTSLDVTRSGVVLVGDMMTTLGPPATEAVKLFDINGVYYGKTIVSDYYQLHSFPPFKWGPTSVRVGPNGMVYVIKAFWNSGGNGYWDPSVGKTYLEVYERSPNFLTKLGSIQIGYSSYSGGGAAVNFPSMAVASDGSLVTMVLSRLPGQNQHSLLFYRSAFRAQFHKGKPWANSIPQPQVIDVIQRGNTQVVDVNFRVNDLDDSQVYSALVGFRDGIIDLAHLVPRLTLLSGSQVDPNPVLRVTEANEVLRAEWDSAADLEGDELVDLKIAALAIDSVDPDDGSGSDVRRLLGFHFLHLDDPDKEINMVINRSPLLPGDFMPLWYWLLATQDGTDPDLQHNRTAGVGEVRGLKGAFTGILLASGTSTTAEGRAFLFEKLGEGSGGTHTYHEATAAELEQARQATNYQASGTVNQWDLYGKMQVEGKPKKVNEWGFDTGDWGADAWWVVREEVTP